MWPNPHLMVADGSRCTLCQNPFGPEGCFTVGSRGAQFHPPCLISCMIKKRSCPHCRSRFHSRLYLQFGLLKYMPSNWVCDPKYLPFPLGEWTGQEMEWSWRHQCSKVENFYQEEDGEWITNPTCDHYRQYRRLLVLFFLVFSKFLLDISSSRVKRW